MDIVSPATQRLLRHPDVQAALVSLHEGRAQRVEVVVNGATFVFSRAEHSQAGENR